MQDAVSIKVQAGTLYHATETAFKLFEHSITLPPAQKAVSFPATATGEVTTVTHTESESEHTPLYPVTPKQVVPTAGETVMQFPVAMGVHAGSECHTYTPAPDAQSVIESP
jgi:hypothetical protein